MTERRGQGIAGYIGLGNMGAPLARRLLRGRPLLVFDRNPAAVAEMAALGAEPCADARELVARCDEVVLCLPTTADVRELLLGAAGAARRGTLIVDQTSGDPIAARAMIPPLAGLGVEMVDAPVSGGPEGANAGTIAILVGGSDAQFARVAPLLALISPNVFHAGAFGCGYVAKLANNLMFSAQRLVTLEAVAMAAKNGVAPGRMVEILLAGSARNFFLEHTMVPRVLKGRLDSGFTLGLAQKDVRLATELGMASDVPMIFGNLVREFYQICIAELGRDAQVNEVARIVDRLAGVSVVPGASEF